MLKTHGRAAVIHPTGTGKSFIAFKLIEEHPDAQFLWLSPNDYIFESQRRNVSGNFNNVVHMTYTRLIRMNEEELNLLCSEYIILDEFHRCGAYCWGTGVERLLKNCPRAKVLGLSATPIRYLDNCRNMAEELFTVKGKLCVASEMTLGEAIVRGILPAPQYVTTMFQYQQELHRYQKRINWQVPNGAKDISQRQLNALRRALGQADGLEKIFSRHLKRNGKYILFCTDWAQMQKIKAQLPQWLRGIDDSPQIYCLYAGERETEAEYEEFLKDQRNHLRLLLCINRLNEGVHVADIDGVILFRVTSSPILYKQQIGRALTTGNGKQPLILDIVNNFDGLSSVGTIRAEMAAAVQKLRSAGKENLVRVDKFPIEEQVEDSIRLVRELENTLNNTWDTWYAEACAYFSSHGNLAVPRRYVTESRMQLGVWIQTQRAVFNGKARGNLTDEQVNALNAICSCLPLLLSFLKVSFNMPVIGGAGYCEYLFLGYYITHYNIPKKIRTRMIYPLGAFGLLLRYVGTLVESFHIEAVGGTFSGYERFPCVVFSVAVFVWFWYHDWSFLNSGKKKHFLRVVSGASFGVYLTHFYILRYFVDTLQLDMQSWQWRVWGVPAVYLSSLIITLALKRVPRINKLVP